MTANALPPSQQAALQNALIDAKLLKATPVEADAISEQHRALNTVAVALYRFKLRKIQWSSFLQRAISAVANCCDWLQQELLRCQREYKAAPTALIISEQTAFVSGLLIDELSFIEQCLAPTPAEHED